MQGNPEIRWNTGGIDSKGSKDGLPSQVWQADEIGIFRIRGPTFVHRVRHDYSLGKFINWELYRAMQFSIQEQLLSTNVERSRGGLVFKAQRLLHYSTLGSCEIQKKRSV